MKTCSKCGIERMLSFFYDRPDTKDGKYPDCKWCRRRYHQTWHKENPAKQRAYMQKWRYGVEPGEFDQMLAEQGGLCAICRRPPSGGATPTLVIDHVHGTKQIRKLLCAQCNRAIGQMRDDPTLLRAAADYIEAHR